MLQVISDSEKVFPYRLKCVSIKRYVQVPVQPSAVQGDTQKNPERLYEIFRILQKTDRCHKGT